MITRLSTIVLAALMLLSVAGCAPFSLVPPGRTPVAGGLAVQPGIAWNKERLPPEAGAGFNSAPIEAWTINGPLLDRLLIVGGLADGQPILRAAGTDADKLPPFRRAMSATEVMDLFESAFARTTGTTPKTRDLRPVKVGGVDGFRFEMSYSGKDEVDREVSVVGAVRGDKLYLLAFSGTKLYHYNQGLPEFDKIVASAQFIGS